MYMFLRFCKREPVVDSSIVLFLFLSTIMVHPKCLYNSCSTTTVNGNLRCSLRVLFLENFCCLAVYPHCPVSLAFLLWTTYLLSAPCSINIAIVFCSSGYLSFNEPRLQNLIISNITFWRNFSRFWWNVNTRAWDCQSVSEEGPPIADFGDNIFRSYCCHSCLHMVASCPVWKEQRGQSVPNHWQFYSAAMAQRQKVWLYDRSHEEPTQHDNPDCLARWLV